MAGWAVCTLCPFVGACFVRAGFVGDSLLVPPVAWASSEWSIVGYSLLFRPNGLHHLHLHRSNRNIFQEALCVLRIVKVRAGTIELKETEMRDACPLDGQELFLMVKLDNSVPGASDLGATLARGTLLPRCGFTASPLAGVLDRGWHPGLGRPRTRMVTQRSHVSWWFTVLKTFYPQGNGSWLYPQGPLLLGLYSFLSYQEAPQRG